MAEAPKNQPFGEVLGDLYARWTLDCLIEIAHAVSLDFVAQPNRYRGSDVPENIVDLRSSYGYQRNYPNQTQRTEVNSPIFGASDGYIAAKGGAGVSDDFHNLRSTLFKACVIFTRRSVVDAPGGLKDDIIKAVGKFVPPLSFFEGTSLQFTSTDLQFVSGLAYEIFRSPVVSGRFGFNGVVPTVEWPLKADDEIGAQLIVAISKELQLKEWGKTEDQFRNLRSMAQDGNEALQSILLDDPTGQGRFDALVSKIYSWAQSVETYQGPGLPSAR